MPPPPPGLIAAAVDRRLLAADERAAAATATAAEDKATRGAAAAGGGGDRAPPPPRRRAPPPPPPRPRPLRRSAPSHRLRDGVGALAATAAAHARELGGFSRAYWLFVVAGMCLYGAVVPFWCDGNARSRTTNKRERSQEELP